MVSWEGELLAIASRVRELMWCQEWDGKVYTMYCDRGEAHPWHRAFDSDPPPFSSRRQQARDGGDGRSDARESQCAGACHSGRQGEARCRYPAARYALHCSV